MSQAGLELRRQLSQREIFLWRWQRGPLAAAAAVLILDALDRELYGDVATVDAEDLPAPLVGLTLADSSPRFDFPIVGHS